MTGSLLEALRENLFNAPLLASGSCRHSLASSFQTPHSNLCLSSPCILSFQSVSKVPSSFKDTSHRVRTTLIQSTDGQDNGGVRGPASKGEGQGNWVCSERNGEMVVRHGQRWRGRLGSVHKSLCSRRRCLAFLLKGVARRTLTKLMCFEKNNIQKQSFFFSFCAARSWSYSEGQEKNTIHSTDVNWKLKLGNF